jgi:hypothetical protein
MCDLNVMAAHYSRITLQNMYIKLIMDPFDHLRWCWVLAFSGVWSIVPLELSAFGSSYCTDAR